LLYTLGSIAGEFYIFDKNGNSVPGNPWSWVPGTTGPDILPFLSSILQSAGGRAERGRDGALGEGGQTCVALCDPGTVFYRSTPRAHARAYLHSARGAQDARVGKRTASARGLPRFLRNLLTTSAASVS